MKVLGISGSPRKDRTTDQLVQAVLDACDCDTEFVSLAGKKIGPCTACLGCVKSNVCVIKDDMAGMREKILSADAYVIGAPNYFSMLNAQTHCFLERWYQFRHNNPKLTTGKLGVAVGVGGGMPQPVADNLKDFFKYNQVECIAEVTAQGPACCFECGYGEDCEVGAIHMFFGPGTKITEEMIPSLDKQPYVLAAAEKAGKALYQRLKEFAVGS
jgi:multimeric flavodoxin WrbA